MDYPKIIKGNESLLANFMQSEMESSFALFETSSKENWSMAETPEEESSSRCFDGNHSQQINETLDKFRLTDSKYCDVVLEADGQTFPAHKCVLASMSDYFDKLFTVDFQEKYKDSIKVTQVSAATLNLVLNYIYTSKVSLDKKNAYDVLVASDYFMLQSLKQFCGVFLDGNQSPRNSIKIWQYAKKYNAEDLEKKSGKFIANHFHQLTEEESLLDLDLEIFKQIVLLKDQHECFEENVYKLNTAWVCHKKEERFEYFPQLFSLLNLNRISKQFFSEVVLEQGLIMEYDDLYSVVVKTICSQILDENRKRTEMELFIKPSTSMLVVTSNGALRKFDIRNNYQEPVCCKEFDEFKVAVKMQGWIYLLGCKEKRDEPPEGVYRWNWHSNKVAKFSLKSPVDGWQDATSLPEGREIKNATVVNDSFIVAARSDGTYVLDAKTSLWTKLTKNYFSQEACLISTKGQVIGMRSGYSYNVLDETWNKIANTVEGAVTGIACDDDVYVFANANRANNYIRLWRYNLHDGKTSVNQMAATRSVTDACIVDGKIVAVVESKEMGNLLMECDHLLHQLSEWRVILRVKCGDFKNIFSLKS